jgi:hypothetical protein
MLSEIVTYREWPWPGVGTDFGENNIVTFMVGFFLRAFSVAFLTHDNAF